MTRPIVVEHSQAEDGSTIETSREMNDGEFAIWSAAAAQQQADADASALQATKLAAVNAKLAAMNLTADDLITLGISFKALP